MDLIEVSFSLIVSASSGYSGYRNGVLLVEAYSPSLGFVTLMLFILTPSGFDMLYYNLRQQVSM